MVFDKLREARKLLGVGQADAASGSGLNQKDISLLESGKKTFIPVEYIQFLYKGGIDLNSLFDDKEKVKLRSDSALSPLKTQLNGHESGTNQGANSGQFVTKNEFSELEKLVKDLLKKLDN